MMGNFVLEDRSRIIFGKGGISRLKEEVVKYKNILLVYGMGSVVKNGILDKVLERLEDKKVFFFGGVVPNPKISKIREGISVCKEKDIDLILAVGGGSVMDSAKAIAIGAKSHDDIWDIMVNGVEISDSVDVGTIPTMIATGSEANDIFVVFNNDINLKRSFRNRLAYPKFTIMDPLYTVSINKRQTIAGIVDTLSHLLEQYVNDKGNKIVNSLLAAYFRRMLVVGEMLVKNLENYDLRAEHMYIAMMAYNGDYRTIVGGDFACHGLDYGLASEFNTIHGEGLSIFTCNWLRHIYEHKGEPRVIEQFFLDVFSENNSLVGIEKLREYFKKIGAPTKYSDINLDISEEELNRMVEKAQFIKPLGNTIHLSHDDILSIYVMSKY